MRDVGLDAAVVGRVGEPDDAVVGVGDPADAVVVVVDLADAVVVVSCRSAGCGGSYGVEYSRSDSGCNGRRCGSKSS